MTSQCSEVVLQTRSPLRVLKRTFQLEVSLIEVVGCIFMSRDTKLSEYSFQASKRRQMIKCSYESNKVCQVEKQLLKEETFSDRFVEVRRLRSAEGCI